MWQFCDASDRAAHVGLGNGYSLGIEIVNRANGKPYLTPGGKHPREVYPERVHGHNFRCTAFYPAQVSAARGLTQALCAVYGLPYEAPVSDTVLDVPTLASFRGVLGHFHYTRRKADPGTRLFKEMGLR